ncbi:hypothetical protein [Arthrobacter zhaoguopingii]|uniref:hypothetical protein n=1 Tax=Arthrobacter zhaoguopingii TaxID=2681491 RepID=UPI00135B012D|nr:hypothetical protein [Arthrobacter zhaoguopingii]
MNDYEQAPDRTRLDKGTLFAYLDTHLLGATNGVRLFEAASRSWDGTASGAELAEMARGISGERDTLVRLIHALGHRPGRLKMAAAHTGSLISSVNPINLLRRRSGEGAQLEFEALQSLLRGKEALWDTLLFVAGTPAGRREPALDPTELERLLKAAREQQQTVARIMRETAVERFFSN